MQVQNVCISGMGIICSIGDTVSSFTESLKSGKSGIAKRINEVEPRVSVDIAAEIKNFGFIEKLNKYTDIPEATFVKAKKLGQRAPLPIQVSILSAIEAFKMAGLFDTGFIPERTGIIVAGQNSTQNYQYKLLPGFKEKPQYLSPRYGLEFLETNQLGVLSELFGCMGEGFVVGGASATGNVGLIKGFQSVRMGLVDTCLVVGVMADLSPMDVQGFCNMGAMGGKKFLDQPEKACRPFDSCHEGFIYGQGGACIVFESGERINQRGKESFLAEIMGGSLCLDANSSSDPNLNGEMKVMRTAIAQSGFEVSDIEYVNTHGSSSPLGDKTEAEAISQVFTNHIDQVWVNATKGLTGHCLYAAGMVETIATVVQMKGGFLHPNKNLEEPIKNLNFCGDRVINQQVDIAISNSFGFGGINTSIVLKNS